MKSLLKLVVSVVCVAVTVRGFDSYLSTYKKHEGCDTWAIDDKECINNPRFMWTDCIGSCLDYVEDDHENCSRWAAEGECTENPSYIHIHCPRSCALAIAWNPWVRRQLGIVDINDNDIDHDSSKDMIDTADNLFNAAEIIRERCNKFLGGLSSSLHGLSSTAPSEYLGMVGLAESILYSLRLYEIILSTLHEDELKGETVAKINHVLNVLKSGYSSDKIMLQLPSWIRFIEDSSQVTLDTIKKRSPSLENPTELLKAHSDELQFENVVPYILGDNYVENLESEKYLQNGTTTATLNNGIEMPLVGLGTWQLDGDDAYHAVYNAISLGYRLIDTAEVYGNEEDVGKAIAQVLKEGIVKREDLFIATKLSNPEKHAGKIQIQSFVKEQLHLLQVDYIDLYMLHSPIQDKRLQAEIWLGLEILVEEGLIRSLGVSNFDSKELFDLLTNSVKKIKPTILQNKLDIYHVGKQIDIRGDTIMSYCRENNIKIMAYSSFTAYPFVMVPIADPIVNFIARKLSFSLGKKVTAGQVIMKWITQRGMIGIPRSTNKDRLTENLETIHLPNLSKEYMALIDTLQFLISSPISVPVLPNA
jgi:diketogulonate reductase-like aldo/keto reductase